MRRFRRERLVLRPCRVVESRTRRPVLGDPLVLCLQKAAGFELSAKEAILGTLRGLFILAAALVLGAPALAAETFPKTGSAKLAAYSVCRSAVIVDMGPVGSNSSAECIGIVKTRDGSKLLDNLSIRCQEDAKARPEGYAFTGTCIHTDADGDKIFMTYEGPESGTVALIGGTGKYKDIAGSGTGSAPGARDNNAQLFLFTLNYDVTGAPKGKGGPPLLPGEK